MSDKIDVLLGTYNGAAHLTELLASLETQSHTNWRLIARDDGSADETVALLTAFASRSRREVLLLERGDGPGGACANFAELLSASTGPYFAFADQDDVWLPNKLAVLLEAVQAEEAAHGRKSPILAHSDLEVVDALLRPIGPSYWKMLRFDPRRRGHKSEALLENFVTGCASMGNAALRAKALPVPAEAVMHDWWLALVATYLGQLAAVTQPTVCYRQHGNNVVGASEWGLTGLARRFLNAPVKSIARTRRIVVRTQEQARVFAYLHANDLSEADRHQICEWAHAADRTAFSRKLVFARTGLRTSYPLRTLLYWMVL